MLMITRSDGWLGTDCDRIGTKEDRGRKSCRTQDVWQLNLQSCTAWAAAWLAMQLFQLAETSWKAAIRATSAD